MPGPEIRPLASDTDRETAANLLHAILGAHLMWSPQHVRQLVSDDRLDSRTFGAFEGDQLRAVGVMRLHDPSAAIQALATDEAHRRQGYGRRVIRAMEGAAAELDKHLMFVCAAPGSEVFYAAQGYTSADGSISFMTKRLTNEPISYGE